MLSIHRFKNVNFQKFILIDILFKPFQNTLEFKKTKIKIFISIQIVDALLQKLLTPERQSR